MSFQRVASLSTLAENVIVPIKTKDVNIILVRRGDQIYALENQCTHAEVSFDKGNIERDCIVCPLHGAAFDIVSGEAKKLPATEALEVFATRIVGDDVEVDLD